MRFWLSSKVLNGGLMYVFFPLKSCLKKSCFAPNTWSSWYREYHSCKWHEWCNTSPMPSTSREKCFCSSAMREGGVVQQFLSSQECRPLQLQLSQDTFDLPDLCWVPGAVRASVPIQMWIITRLRAEIAPLTNTWVRARKRTKYNASPQERQQYKVSSKAGYKFASVHVSGVTFSASPLSCTPLSQGATAHRPDTSPGLWWADCTLHPTA